MKRLEIDKEIFRQIIFAATAAAPLECCGYLAGIDKKITWAYPMKNMDQSKEHFSFDAGEQFATVKEIRKQKQKVLAVYHSHPETPARPSEEDVRLAFDPDISHVIISLCGEKPVVRSFQIRNGVVEPEELTIL